MAPERNSLSILVINQRWFVDELRERGHRVVFAGWKAEEADVHISKPGMSLDEIMEKLPRGFVPDRIVYFDNSNLFLITGLERVRVPTLFYSVDAHHHTSWHKYAAAAFDRVLVAQKDYLPQFTEVVSDLHWFPLWAPFHVEPEVEKTQDVSFRGNLDAKLHPARASFYTELAKHVDIDTSRGPYAEVYGRSKIVVNQTVKADLNFRVFEAMMCGAMLITPKINNGLLDLFEEGRDIVLYEEGDAQGAAKQVQYYLEHDEERAQIAKSGRDKVVSLHSADARAEELERHLLDLSITSRPYKHFGISVAHIVGARTMYGKANRVSNILLAEAVGNLVESAANKELQDQAFLSAVIQCEFCFEQRESKLGGEEFLRNVRQNYPYDALLGMVHIHALTQSDKLDEAHRIAKDFSDNPEELVAATPHVIQSLRNELGMHQKGSGVVLGN